MLKILEDTSEVISRCEIIVKRDADQYIAGPVLIADVMDRQEHIISSRDVQLAAWKWAYNGFESNLMHEGPDLEPEEALVVASWVNDPSESGPFNLGGKSFHTTTWFMGVLLGDTLWKKVQSGELTGFSIEGEGVLQDA